MEFTIGQKVHYKYTNNTYKSENGIIKEIREHWIFVVFKCDNDWENYTKYTSEGCDPKNLCDGWIKKLLKIRFKI